MIDTILMITLILTFCVVIFALVFIVYLQNEIEKYARLKKRSKKLISERVKGFSQKLSSKQLNILINVLKK